MSNTNNILQLIKKSVLATEPDATVILYGSYARGDNNDSSDIDVLVLLNKDAVTRQDQKRIQYPLYKIEFDTGTIISPMVFAKRDWEARHRVTPFYENVLKEGKVL